MNAYLCATCGTQYPPSEAPPDRCPICEDERQYVGLSGQTWTTLEQIQKEHSNLFEPYESGLTAIRTDPEFAIGQRAFFIESAGGNLLWDCVALLDAETKDFIRARGGLKAIAISHPHYYTTMGEWSSAFGDVPIYLHSADRDHVMRPNQRIVFWEGETLNLHDGLTLLRCGGHFA